MEIVSFALCFEGNVQPAGDDSARMEVKASGQSVTLTAKIAEHGVEGSRELFEGHTAQFASEVVSTGDTTFSEEGTIAYGNNNRIHFSTVGEGYIDGAPVDGLQHGAVTWRVDKGEGVFKGASGLITSNFTVDQDGQLKDHQFATLFTKP